MADKRYDEMTDYERAVASAAVQIYNSNMTLAQQADVKGEGVPSDPMVAESALEAIEIVNAVLEMTR
jgi:hypothetical protein